MNQTKFLLLFFALLLPCFIEGFFRCRNKKVKYGYCKLKSRFVYTKVSCKCNSGYRLVGRRTMKCVLGKWSAPKCFPIDDIKCDPPRQFLNGRLITKGRKVFSFGDGLWFRCNPGFKLVGAADITCEAKGKWSSPFPVCKDTRCLPPTNFPNGRMITKGKTVFSVKDGLWFRCDPAYKLVGASDIYCRENKKWSAPFPICKGTARDCKGPSEFANGFFEPIQDRYKPGKELWFGCNNGFKIKGEADIVCEDGGKWSDHFPVCESTIRVCKGPVTFDYGTFSPVKPRYQPEDELIFECDDDDYFELKGEAKIVCQRNGRWSGKFPICESTVPLCHRPETFPNGKMEPKRDYYLPGDGLWFECNENHVIKGEYDVFCEENGEWSPKIPQCEKPTCPQLQNPTHGSFNPVKDVYHVNDEVTFTCGPGFELEGVSQLLCIPEGWIDHPPTCKAKKVNGCTKPREPKNGYITPKLEIYKVGQKAWYKCNRGYVVKNHRAVKDIVCKSDGTWTAPPIQCRRRFFSLFFKSKRSSIVS